MSRKKKASFEDLILPISGFLVLGWMFLPGFRILVVCLGILSVTAFLGFIILRLVAHKNRATELAKPPNNANQHFNSPHHEVLRTTTSSQSLADKLRSLDWFQFEKLIGAIYQAKGYEVKRLGGANPDRGVDLFIAQNGIRMVVQCKHWKSWSVGVKQTREFLGTLADQQVSSGIFITMKGYSREAREFAAKHKITLLDENDVVQLLEKLEWKWNPAIKSVLNDSKKMCPKCECELVLRTAGRGRNAGNQFWGCSAYPKCRFVLN